TSPRRDHGLTLLMVSHDLAVIAHLCERIGVMNSGQLVEITTATAMASNQSATRVRFADMKRLLYWEWIY
ncbi:MAG: hypothetical protein V4673_03465, partial [Pseudomonadota bacterium]